MTAVISFVLAVAAVAQTRAAPKPDLRQVVELQARQIADLEKRIADLEKRLNALAGADKAKDGRPVKGMTLGEVSDLMRRFPLYPDKRDPLVRDFGVGKRISESADGEEYEWTFGNFRLNGFFQNGRLVDWTYTDPGPTPAPANRTRLENIRG